MRRLLGYYIDLIQQMERQSGRIHISEFIATEQDYMSLLDIFYIRRCVLGLSQYSYLDISIISSKHISHFPGPRKRTRKNRAWVVDVLRFVRLRWSLSSIIIVLLIFGNGQTTKQHRLIVSNSPTPTQVNLIRFDCYASIAPGSK